MPSLHPPNSTSFRISFRGYHPSCLPKSFRASSAKQGTVAPSNNTHAVNTVECRAITASHKVQLFQKITKVGPSNGSTDGYVLCRGWSLRRSCIRPAHRPCPLLDFAESSGLWLDRVIQVGDDTCRAHIT